MGDPQVIWLTLIRLTRMVLVRCVSMNEARLTLYKANVYVQLVQRYLECNLL